MAVHHTKIVKHKPELQIRTAYSTKPLLLCEYQFKFFYRNFTQIILELFESSQKKIP